jgi:hypothetical protein
MNGLQGKVINFRKKNWRVEDIFPKSKQKMYLFQHTAMQLYSYAGIQLYSYAAIQLTVI